ncbi:MAG: 4-(cytidine 5'-diphospho)-2-C-methyl-D-erythritol kinase, partial [Bacteroidales bacterium]|nr:4-(cytidine 5'-diphospho)-2-C-methyl-D-erythritol kinase [Bacteroidales bacterium]
MILFPYCKINLGLQIVAKRPDGFHDLDTVFLPIPDWFDILEILPASQDEFILTGATLDGNPQDNLVCRAREAARRQLALTGRTLPPCRLHLHKTLPAGAGLGGGSSDATHTLLGLNRLFDLGFSVAEIEAMIRPLGSDCAFFSVAAPARATGRGDVLERLPSTDTPDCHLWIIV